MNDVIHIGKEKVPALGLGTYKLDGRAGEEAISVAISIGYRHLDTAQFYRNEDVVGNAVKRSGINRKEFFIVTKVWPGDFNKRNFVPNVERSLRLLKSDYIDLLLLHWPSDEATNDRAVELLAECHTKGYARLIGVSNFSIAQLKRAQRRAPIFCNQVEYNPYRNQQEMLKYVQENELLMTAYSPLAVGRIERDKTLTSLAEKYQKTPGQIVLRWLLQQKNVSPIPKANNEKHLKENRDVFDVEISEEDMEVMYKLGR
jgi:diketogulonate reductase-like aldo/keto reductase